MNVFNFSQPLSAKQTDPLTGDAVKLPSVEAFYGPYESLSDAVSKVLDTSEGYLAVMGVNPPLGLKLGVQATGESFKEYQFVGYKDGTDNFNATNCVLVGSGGSTEVNSTLKSSVTDKDELDDILNNAYSKDNMIYCADDIEYSASLTIPKGSLLIATKDRGASGNINDFAVVSSSSAELADVTTSTQGILSPSRADDLTFKLESVVTEGKVYDGFEAIKTAEDGVYIIDKNGDAVLIADEDGLHVGNTTSTTTTVDPDTNIKLQRIINILGSFYGASAADDVKITID